MFLDKRHQQFGNIVGRAEDNPHRVEYETFHAAFSRDSFFDRSPVWSELVVKTTAGSNIPEPDQIENVCEIDKVVDLSRMPRTRADQHEGLPRPAAGLPPVPVAVGVLTRHLLDRSDEALAVKAAGSHQRAVDVEHDVAGAHNRQARWS